MSNFNTDIDEKTKENFKKYAFMEFGIQSKPEVLVGIQKSSMHDELVVSWSEEICTAFVYIATKVDFLNCAYKTDVTSEEEAQEWGKWICSMMQNSGGLKRY